MQSPRSAILIVANDAATTELLRQVLEGERYTVVTTADGGEALRRLAAGGVCLVLLDRILPDEDGWELCRRVRALEGEVHLPIIMLGGSAAEAERHGGDVIAADDYVAKPIKSADLLDRVQVWMWIHERLKAAHEERRRADDRGGGGEASSQGWGDQDADAAVLAMARTASDQLRQPLTALLGWLDLWKDTGFSEEAPEVWYARFRAAADSLAARVDALTRVVRYETKEVGGQMHLDLPRSQRSGPTEHP